MCSVGNVIVENITLEKVREYIYFGQLMNMKEDVMMNR